MTGALMALAGAPGVSGGGGGTHPNAIAWGNIYDSGSGSTATPAVAGIVGGSAVITAMRTGTAVLYYNLNGGYVAYTGGFTVSNGDTLGWTLYNSTVTTKSGTVTVSSLGFTVGTFTYVITGNFL